MNKVVKVAGIGIAAVAIVAGGFFAGAQVANAQGGYADALSYGPGSGLGLNGPCGGLGDGILVDYRDETHAAIAEGLGMTVEEFEAAITSGQTAWQIAQAQGLDAEQFRAIMLEARSAALAQAVEDGKLTQEQADAMLARMQNRMGQGFGPAGYGQGFGPGKGQGFGPGNGPKP